MLRVNQPGSHISSTFNVRYSTDLFIMKNFLLSFIVLLICTSSDAQMFHGVPISGSLQLCMANFQKKGFVFVKFNPHGVTMSGNVYNLPVELYIVATPRSKTVCKVSLYFPKRKSWSILLDEYVQMKKQLILKYGAPDLQMETFHHPYKLGDGLETTALQAEKCEYCTIWLNKINTNAIVEISEFLQIYLAFENKSNMELSAKEEAE